MDTKQAISREINLPVKEIEVNGTNLAYIEQGAGEPVIFIHGAVSDFRTWLEQIGAFSNNYRAISYSRRYHQPNDRNGSSSGYSRDLHTADLVGFIKALKLEKPHLVGHSYGASIALMAALDYPDLIGSLILGEPSPFPSLLSGDVMPLLAEQKAGFEKAIRLAENGDAESAVREFLHTIVGVDVLCLLPDERRSVVLENAGTLLPMLRTYYESPRLSCEQLRHLNVPTLVITGEFSPRISRLNDEIIANCLPDSEVKILKGASHGLQIENPEGFNDLVLDFLAAHTNTVETEKRQQLFEPILY